LVFNNFGWLKFNQGNTEPTHLRNIDYFDDMASVAMNTKLFLSTPLIPIEFFQVSLEGSLLLVSQNRRQMTFEYKCKRGNSTNAAAESSTCSTSVYFSIFFSSQKHKTAKCLDQN